MGAPPPQHLLPRPPRPQLLYISFASPPRADIGLGAQPCPHKPDRGFWSFESELSFQGTRALIKPYICPHTAPTKIHSVTWRQKVIFLCHGAPKKPVSHLTRNSLAGSDIEWAPPDPPGLERDSQWPVLMTCKTYIYFTGGVGGGGAQYHDTCVNVEIRGHGDQTHVTWSGS